ncbi:MAG: ATP synthase subunit I [Thermodesulfobacteriota bacterium]
MDNQTYDNMDFPLQRMEIASWLVLITATTGTWFVLGNVFLASSILIGGLIANTSYYFMKRDLVNFLQGALQGDGKEKVAKARYYVKYYIRLAALALILYVIIKNQFAQPIALIVGLSTVVISIGLTVASVAKQYFSAAEEA